MTELDKLKVLSALKLGYGKLTAKNTTEKEFENIEQAIEIVKKLIIPSVVVPKGTLVCASCEGTGGRVIYDTYLKCKICNGSGAN